MNTSTSQQSDRLQAIRARAILYQHIREFFGQRQVLEVETPILQATAHSDNRAMIIQQHITGEHSSDPQISLQTSPALAMQQLLACGCGAIYQICKVFQHTNNVHEHKRKHSSEFSMLAWYTPDATFTQLMQDSQDLLAHVFGYEFDIETISYQDIFARRLDMNPHQADLKQLKNLARRVGLNINYGEDRLAWLDGLFCHFVEPTLGYNQPMFLTDFPVEQITTTQTNINDDGMEVAAKFDLYIDGLKLVSGQVAQAEQIIENQQAILKHGRIFLGLDRLLMLLMDKHRIDQVMSFSPPMR